MNKKRRGLGNLGVDVLLSASGSGAARGESGEGELRQLAVESIRRGRYQPRVHIRAESLQELAESIRAQGMVQPVVVRPLDEGYELIAGERRWRAAQLAGLHDLPALIKPIPDQAAAAMSLIENIQREDLSPLEEAGAFQRLIADFELTHQQVAAAVGRSRAGVSNFLRLLELTEPAKQLLDEGKLEMGHARALLSLQGEQQAQAARDVAARGLSVRETERHVRRLTLDVVKPSRAAAPSDPDVSRLERSLGETLGARVNIRHGAQGRGRLVIHYTSLDELDGILAHIR